jgi:tetratricopeptide (TPR) repeat protein
MRPDRRNPHDARDPRDETWQSAGLELDACTRLQAELSMLADGELDEYRAARAIAELESCPACGEFFDSVRDQIRLHRELHDPETMRERYADLVGAPGVADLEVRQAVHRLADIFYQLGKAYALSAIDPDFRTRVFERAVAVEPTRLRGRGFVDGVAARGDSDLGGFDWRSKRHLLNGTLERIDDPLAKARRLLEEALEVEPDHEPAQLYLGFLDARAGRTMAAARRFREVFDTAVEEGHRGHAASQLGVLLVAEESYREALVWFRWIGLSGLADFDSRFFVTSFNVGLCYAHLGRQERALTAFREMLDRHPDRVSEVADFFARSPKLQRAIDAQPGFTERLAFTCPELFAGPGKESER